MIGQDMKSGPIFCVPFLLLEAAENYDKIIRWAYSREESSMNVYDEMNKLCEGIKETHEFTKIQEAKKKLSADKDAEAMVKDFLQQKSQLELLQYQGKKPDEEAVKKMQKLYEVLQLNPVANEYIQNYIRFQMMIGDLSKTLGDTIKEAVEWWTSKRS